MITLFFDKSIGFYFVAGKIWDMIDIGPPIFKKHEPSRKFGTTHGHYFKKKCFVYLITINFRVPISWLERKRKVYTPLGRSAQLIVTFLA